MYDTGVSFDNKESIDWYIQNHEPTPSQPKPTNPSKPNASIFTDHKIITEPSHPHTESSTPSAPVNSSTTQAQPQPTPNLLVHHHHHP